MQFIISKWGGTGIKCSVGQKPWTDEVERDIVEVEPLVNLSEGKPDDSLAKTTQVGDALVKQLRFWPVGIEIISRARKHRDSLADLITTGNKAKLSETELGVTHQYPPWGEV